MIAEENTVDQKKLERVVKKTGSQQLNREDVKDRCKLRESIKSYWIFLLVVGLIRLHLMHRMQRCSLLL